MFDIISKMSMTDWAALVAVVVSGGFAFFSLFNQKMKDRRNEGDQVDDRLITLLKETVGGLEKKVEILEEQQKINVTEIATLKTENEIMKKIFQGRDSTTIEFQKRGLEANEKIDTLLTISTATNQNIERLTNILSEHFNPITK